VTLSFMPQDTGGKGDLRAEMVEILAGIARDHAGRPRSAMAAVSAAGRVISAIDDEADPAALLVKLMGSDEAAAEWMRATLPKLEARIAAKRATPLLGEGESDHETGEGQ